MSSAVERFQAAVLEMTEHGPITTNDLCERLCVSRQRIQQLDKFAPPEVTIRQVNSIKVYSRQGDVRLPFTVMVSVDPAEEPFDYAQTLLSKLVESASRPEGMTYTEIQAFLGYEPSPAIFQLMADGRLVRVKRGVYKAGSQKLPLGLRHRKQAETRLFEVLRQRDVAVAADFTQSEWRSLRDRLPAGVCKARLGNALALVLSEASNIPALPSLKGA